LEGGAGERCAADRTAKIHMRNDITGPDINSSVEVVWVHNNVVIAVLAIKASPRRSCAVLITPICISVYESAEGIVEGPLDRSTICQGALGNTIDEERNGLRTVVGDEVFSRCLHRERENCQERKKPESTHGLVPTRSE